MNPFAAEEIYVMATCAGFHIVVTATAAKDKNNSRFRHSVNKP